MQARFLVSCVAIGLMQVGCDKSSSESPTPTASSRPAATQPVAAPKPMVVGPLKVTIASVDVASEYGVYVGGGSNISPPEPMGSGGGMPMISMSNNSSFLAGKINAKDENTKLMRIECVIENPTEKPVSFKIGDMSLTVAGVSSGDFAAVGYGTRMCAMDEADRTRVKAINVEVSPKSQRTLSYLFAITPPDAKTGEVALQNSVAPVSFRIDRP